MFARLVCLVRREHDYRLREGDGRVYLHCRRCGVRTPGWETSPRVRVIPTQPPPLRLLLEDVAPPRPTGAPLRLLLADNEPEVADDLRLLLADTALDRSDAPLVGNFGSASSAEVRPDADFRLGLE